MKRFILISAAFLLTLPLFAQEKSPPLKDQKDKVSYSIGLNIGSNLARQNVEINPDALIAGIKDAIAGKPQLTQDQIKEVMTAFEKDMQAKQKAAGEKSAAEGAKFLEENKKKEGVKTTASGLQYKVIKEGTGAQPKATDTVTVNYRGTLIGGKEFDSSYKRGQPATFPLNGVIKGWTEGLQLMKTGSKYQLFVPPDLAYGERAVGPDLSPNSTLIFEVELLEVKPPDASWHISRGGAPAPQAGTTAGIAAAEAIAIAQGIAEIVEPAFATTPGEIESALAAGERPYFNASQPFPTGVMARRPKDPPGCKKRVCLDETRGQLPAGNRARSIGWPGNRQLPQVESNDPLATRVSISFATALSCGSDVAEQITKKSVNVEIARKSRTTMSSAFLFEASSAQVFARFSGVISLAPGKFFRAE